MQLLQLWHKFTAALAHERTVPSVGYDGEVEATKALTNLIGIYPQDHLLLERAVKVAVQAHHGQKRKSGDAYVTHPLEVAELVALWRMDVTSVVAAILHDVVEDTSVTVSDIETEFGSEVAAVVDGLTKLDGVKFVDGGTHVDARAAANLQKLLLAVADDPRVLIVKLADRLHNVRTLGALPDEKAARIARETMDVHAPLAHRLGMTGVSAELEDLCFQTLRPAAFSELQRQVDARLTSSRFQLEAIKDGVEQQLTAAGIGATVTARTKHLWSVYEKMIVKQRTLDQVYDLAALRVIVDDVASCYAALGVVHQLHQPVAGRFKDWVAAPKLNNMYQSLHTTVMTAGGTPVEVQIRTKEMHRRAEWGIAAHWRYKVPTPHQGMASSWLRSLGTHSNTELEPQTPAEYLEHVRDALVSDEVFCFTPRGDVIALPQHATCLDFAYAIHTEVGHHATGAKVNDRLVPLITELRTGDRVTVLTSEHETPKGEWLEFARSGRARSRIRHWLTHAAPAGDTTNSGRIALENALQELGVPQRLIRPGALGEVALMCGFDDADALLAAVGSGAVKVAEIARQLAGISEPEPLSSAIVDQRSRRGRKGQAEPSLLPVRVEGFESSSCQSGSCCWPVVGDAICGVVVGDTIIVHKAECIAGRQKFAVLADVVWVREVSDVVVELRVEAIDRDGLLADVSRAIALHGAAITASSTSTGMDRMARERFSLRLADGSHLAAVCAAVSAVDGVFVVTHRLFSQ